MLILVSSAVSLKVSSLARLSLSALSPSPQTPARRALPSLRRLPDHIFSKRDLKRPPLTEIGRTTLLMESTTMPTQLRSGGLRIVPRGEQNSQMRPVNHQRLSKVRMELKTAGTAVMRIANIETHTCTILPSLSVQNYPHLASQHIISAANSLSAPEMTAKRCRSRWQPVSLPPSFPLLFMARRRQTEH